MTEIISKWIQNRLGLVVDMKPDNFALKTANGRLLAEILHSYQIVVPEQLNLIVQSDFVKQCYDNFVHINVWLRDLTITIPDEDLYEIVHGIGSASLHLFYRVLLELKDKTQLDFLTDNEINAQLGKKFTRFQVRTDNFQEDPNRMVFHYEGLCNPLLAGGDVYHWYKDRMENLQNRCKEARDEYLHILKTRCRSCDINNMQHLQESGFVLARSLLASPKPSSVNQDPNGLPDEDISYDDRTYEELANKQKEAQQLKPITPDPKEVKKYMKNIKLKSKTRHENKVLRIELHREIMNNFDKIIKESKVKSEDRALTKTFLKQSCFEKELVSKMGQVKMQKQFMIENKSKQAEVLNKIKEREFINTIILQDKQLDEKKLIFYLERDRVLRLHKKIWEERLRLRAKRHETLCSNALKDIIDISMKIADYKKRFGRELSKREINELKHIFVSGQPVFDICEPVVSIIKEKNEVGDADEEIITFETLRQNALDQEEFDSYMNYEWPWELKNVENSSDLIEQISCGINVLGHIVHQVLLTKYPPPPVREKPYFPDAAIRVCVNGLNDPGFIPTLQNLLSEKEIEVIEMRQAVEFCLLSYNCENKREHDEEEIASPKETKKKKADKYVKKGEKSKQKNKGKSVDTETIVTEPPKIFETKSVQTPIIYPCEEIAFSPHAMLGQSAQKILDLGQPLSDDLLIAMFIEYLKSIPKLKGWVLINFPTNYDQAALLEEAFTGINILPCKTMSPDGQSILDIADIEEHSEETIDLLDENKGIPIRNSHLLPNPVEAEMFKNLKVYNTYLTAYIKIKKMPINEHSGDQIFPPVLEELGNEPDPLDKFYSNTGANYSLYYKDFDLTTLKYLGKLIIGDYSLPLKSSVELFGEGVYYMDHASAQAKSLKAVKKGEKETKPRERMSKSPGTTSAAEGSDKKNSEAAKGKKGKGKVIIVHEDKYTQIPSEVEDEIEELYVSSNSQYTAPTAGQNGWVYTVVPCPRELMIALATLWESIEEIYINDLKQVFFLKRLNMNSVMPYVQYVKDIMKETIDKPDHKGPYLAKFQKAFNVFDMDFRRDEEFKAEMYCRIEDFKEKLTELCDGKMMDCENSRCAILNANWATNQITELVNVYINMFQLELDRFTESFRFINDYFMGIFIGKPCEDELWKEDNFPKIADINPGIVNVMLQNIDSEMDLSFFENLLNNLLQKAIACIKKLNINSSNNVDRIKSAQTSNTPKSKSSSPKSKASKAETKSTGVEMDTVKENYGKLVDEWQCAVKGESLRVNLRLELLKYNAIQTLQSFLGALRSCFHSVYNDIRSKYWEEIKNIENACKVFHSAVEKEQLVQKELIFVDHTFCINPEVNLYDNDPIIPELSKEEVEEGVFTVAQLSKLTDILMDLSPNGYIVRASLIFLLQDIIWNNAEDGSDLMVPQLWKSLDPLSLRKVVDAFYDDLEYVYWRDLIVYNLRIAFPTEKELLLTRKHFRECDPDATELIEDYQFYGTKLWFECCYNQEDAARLNEAKQLLGKLYFVKDYGINYTALLLDFCKDTNQILGFAKALELSLGKIVCWNKDMGNNFEEEFLQKVLEHDKIVQLRGEEQAELYRIAYDAVCKLVDHVVLLMEDITIEDYVDEQQKSKKSERSDNKLISKREDTDPPRKSNVLTKTSPTSETSNKGKDIKSSLVELQESAAQEGSKVNINRFETEDVIKQQDKICENNVDTDASEYTQVALFLSLDVILTIVTAALPWHSRVQAYEDLSFCEKTAAIFESKRNPRFNMTVLAHEFLNCNEFLSHLNQTKKFKTLDPVKVIQNIIYNANKV